MAKTKKTIVCWDEICDKGLFFRTIDPNQDSFLVSSFEDGIVTINPMCGCMIQTFSETIAGCFEEGSNFSRELFRYFGEQNTFIGIMFDFNGVTMMVTKENADKIYTKWKEAYLKTATEPLQEAERCKGATWWQEDTAD